MKRIIVAGIGTGVGKTIVSTILVMALEGVYWKPIQTEPDAEKVQEWWPHVHPSAYNFATPISPHAAGKIDISTIVVPTINRPLVIESVGGVLVPLNLQTLSTDLFATWEATWILVSQHYLGSINHTLLTIEALKRRNIALHSIVFNGEPHSTTEEAILSFSNVPCLGRLLPEKSINTNTLQRYAKEWKKNLY